MTCEGNTDAKEPKKSPKTAKVTEIKGGKELKSKHLDWGVDLDFQIKVQKMCKQ